MGWRTWDSPEQSARTRWDYCVSARPSFQKPRRAGGLFPGARPALRPRDIPGPFFIHIAQMLSPQISTSSSSSGNSKASYYFSSAVTAPPKATWCHSATAGSGLAPRWPVRVSTAKTKRRGNIMPSMSAARALSTSLSCSTAGAYKYPVLGCPVDPIAAKVWLTSRAALQREQRSHSGRAASKRRQIDHAIAHREPLERVLFLWIRGGNA